MNYILLQKCSFCPDETNGLQGKSVQPKCLVAVRVEEFWGTHLEQELVLPFNVWLKAKEIGELWVYKILILFLLFRGKKALEDQMQDYLFTSIVEGKCLFHSENKDVSFTQWRSVIWISFGVW